MNNKETVKTNLGSQPSKRYYNNKWFKESDGGVCLVGGKCKLCGMVFFPHRNLCIRCHEGEIEEFELGKRGRLFTFTKVLIPSRNFKPPYVVGYIDLPEGIRIFSQIKGWEKVDLKVGMEMEMIVDNLWETNDGIMIIGYKFVPID